MDYIDTVQYSLTIDPQIVEDIFERTGGHAGLVCL